jgi:hypothetical protein
VPAAKGALVERLIGGTGEAGALSTGRRDGLEGPILVLARAGKPESIELRCAVHNFLASAPEGA